MDPPEEQLYPCRYCDDFITDDVFDRPRHERVCISIDIDFLVSNTRARRRQRRKERELRDAAAVEINDDEAVEENATEEIGEEFMEGEQVSSSAVSRIKYEWPFGSRLTTRNVVKADFTDNVIAVDDSAPFSIKLGSPRDAKVNDYTPFMQRKTKLQAIVEKILSGHRFTLFVPKETCRISFELCGVICPKSDENDAILLMTPKILQKSVVIAVKTMDKNGTFLGSMWEPTSGNNVVNILLEAGLARLKITDSYLLAQAEESAKKHKLKLWDGLVEGEDFNAVNHPYKKQFKALVTEVLGGGKLYVQAAADHIAATIHHQLDLLNLKEAPVIGFNPKKGDIVLSMFSPNNSWNRAEVITAPLCIDPSSEEKFLVLYVDYGNQETVSFNELRPLDPSVSSTPGLAQLCQLAYLKVPDLEEDYGLEAAVYLSEITLTGKEFMVILEESNDTIPMVTLIDEDYCTSINEMMHKKFGMHVEHRPEAEIVGSSGVMIQNPVCYNECKTKEMELGGFSEAMGCEGTVAIGIRKPEPWSHPEPVTRYQLNELRKKFWDAAPISGGSPEIWNSLKATIEGELHLGEAILGSAGIKVHNSDLTICFDKTGVRYELPLYVLSDPINVISDK